MSSWGSCAVWLLNTLLVVLITSSFQIEYQVSQSELTRDEILTLDDVTEQTAVAYKDS